MTLKSRVLSVLELHRGEAVSGQELADGLGVTRAAVWKTVQTLEREGHAIRAVKNVGYSLAGHSDVLTAEGIRTSLKNENKSVKIELLQSVDSTNNELKRRDGEAEELVLFAESQSQGRGRSGKSFFSPAGTSIYVSFRIDPKKTSLQLTNITTAAAVAVQKAIGSSCGKQTQIKWVNDLFYCEKKICGILTEAVTSVENGEIQTVIIGIGINCRLSEERIPEELKPIVGSLALDVPRNMLAAAVIDEVFAALYRTEWSDLLQYARKNSYTLGKTVRYEVNGICYEGVAEDLRPDGALIVRRKSGEIDAVSSGTVTFADE